jgi:hypothetical protein
MEEIGKGGRIEKEKNALDISPHTPHTPHTQKL